MKFEANGNLEPGEHAMTWGEFTREFGDTLERQKLIAGLKAAAVSIKLAGGSKLWVDGSFVTKKELIYGLPPNDFDGCWDVSGVNPTLLDPILLDFNNGRARQKAKFGGELFPAHLKERKSGTTFLEFFQIDKNTGGKKGIVAIDLRSLS